MKYTKDQVDAMDRKELRTAAKAVGIKYGKLSLMQVREQLVTFKTPKVVEKKAKGPARAGTKMLAAIEIVKKNPNAVRKVIIAKFIDEAGLTKAGASTYYQNILKKLSTK